MNMYKWILGGAALVFTVRYLSELRLASENIVSQVSLQIRKVSLLEGIELRAIVRLQNPNPVRLRLQHPFVQLKYRDRLLVSSRVRDEIIDLTPNSERMFDINFQSIGWPTLMQTLGMELVNQIRGGKGVNLQITVITTTRVNNLPFTKEDAITVSI